MNNPKISVITPVYNSGKYLKIAVDSVLSQSLKDIELILIDDGSTDGSSEKCDEYASNDERVKVIHQTNRGICNARNTALKIAIGEYIAFSDHDDEYLPGLLKENYDIAKKNNADIVKFLKKEVVIIHGKKKRIKRNYLNKSVSLNRDGIVNSFWIMEENNLLNSVWDGIFKRSFIVQYNLYFDQIYKNGGEDIDYMLKCVALARHIEINNKVFYIHYIRKDFSTSTKFNEYMLTHIQSFPEKINKCLDELNLPPDSCKSEYVYFYISNILGPIIDILINPKCNWAKTQKIELIRNLKSSPFCYHWLFNVNSFYIFKKEKKYGLLFFLYKNEFYKLCLLLYELREYVNNTNCFSMMKSIN